MACEKTLFADICGKLPKEWRGQTGRSLQKALSALQQKVVVLDDDPTGTQTVHDMPVLTEWSPKSLRAEMANPLPAFYVLTNSRSLSSAQARQLNLTIARTLVRVASDLGRNFVVISRSDSTLRGHFPEEVEALIEGFGEEPDAILLMPFFFDAGRYTIDDVQYVQDGDFLIAAGETEYAQDSSFGYKSSNLREWVQEKTSGRIPAGEVRSISIADIRSGGPDHVERYLRTLCNRAICIVNAVTAKDLEVFTQGLLQSEMAGKRFIYRTAASFVPVRCGLSAHSLLLPEELNLSRQGGGLIIVGSFVLKTTSQLQALLNRAETVGLELNVEAVLDEQTRTREIQKVAEEANRFLKSAVDTTIFTSRQLRLGNSPEENLLIANQVSGALVDVVRSINLSPRYIVAKGGITASDIATKALGVRRSVVRGQLLPGVPVWELGPESRLPGMPYIVFPGNVGSSDALVKIAQALKDCSASTDLLPTSGSP